MSDRCVVTKIYISGHPVSTTEYALYFSDGGEVTALTSWKQLPEAETPVVAVPLTANTTPTAAQVAGTAELPSDWIHGSASSETAKGRSGRNAYRVDPRFEALATDDHTRAALSQLVHNPPTGHGLLISSPPGAGSEEAAKTLAAALAPAEALFYAAPSADRWTVEELDDMVSRPAYLKAPKGTRPVIVVLEADLMPDSVADRMLKILEEPPAGALFILTATAPDKLRPTIRGRLSGHVPIATLPSPQRIARYVDMGLDSDSATRLDSTVGPNLALGSAIAATNTIEDALAALSPTRRDLQRPVVSATETAKALDSLAKKLAGHLAADADDPDADTSSAGDKAHKAAVRMLARTLVDTTVEDLRHRYLTGPDADLANLPADRLIRAVREAARDARAGITSYIPPERVLAGFYTRLSALGV